MKTIELEEMKRIQLDIVQALHDFCIANDIKYSLSCGTLLGAIRHGGYIPWDDDIDVYMEREDYNRFISLFPVLYKDKYKLASLETNKQWHIPFAKMYDNRTTLIEKVKEWVPIGINIDIFPVDRVPYNSNEWKRYNFIRGILVYLGPCKGTVPKKKYSISQNVRLIVGSIIMFFFTRRFHARILNWYAQRYNKLDSAECLFENVSAVNQIRPFNRTDFSSTILHKFEDRELCVMKGFDHCLCCGFGDYMQLPPVEKQVSHHSFKAYWKD